MSLNGIFSGRVGRRDFFVFHVTAVGALLALFVVQRIIVLFLYPESTEDGFAAFLDLVLILLSASYWLLAAFVAVAVIVLSVRRLHDVGYSGLIVLALIALVVLSAVSTLAGAVALLSQFFLFIMKGDEGRNRYGETPSASLFGAKSPRAFKGRPR